VGRIAPWIGLALLAALPPSGIGNYPLHLVIMCLLWAYVYTSWSIMGRLGMVSFGHGAFLGIGAYAVVMMWNHFHVSPWIGSLVAIAASIVVALVIGLPCFRFKIVGHYFALVTLALSQVVLLSLTAARDVTGGSLGLTIRTIGHSWYALQFPDKIYFYGIAIVLWLVGLYAWQRVDHGISREALEAISEDEDAAAAVGINVLREKLRVTIISAALTALGGAIYGQYFMYLNPETVSGIAISLQIVFAVIAGGLYSLMGPTVGAILTLSLTEGLRVFFGTHFIGAANTIYGILLVLCIIFLPQGIVGKLQGITLRRRPPAQSVTAPH